ncbi:MAG: SHOCT domain-containing protein [Oscillospiraceae bacterium]|nr:SHOCT domain-containing protein [Oscillospiraceae bacterium]
MRKKLTVAQSILVIISAILCFTDGTFTWIAYNAYRNIGSNAKSLNNIMIVQEIGGGPYLYYVYCLGLVLMLGYCLWEMFAEERVIGKKVFLAVSALPAIIYAIILIAVDNYHGSYTWEGEIRYNGVSLGILAYIGIIILVAIFVIECYKQFKCNNIRNPYQNKNSSKKPSTSNIDELLKLKELHDSGVITKEEFDEKKKQLLGL